MLEWTGEAGAAFGAAAATDGRLPVLVEARPSTPAS